MTRIGRLHGSVKLAAAALSAALTPTACDRSVPEPPPLSASAGAKPAAPPAPSSAPPAPAKPHADAPFRYPAQPRLVALGDVHGDLKALKRALRLARAIDDQDRWIGKGLSVVQTGDQLDRGDQDRAVLDFLEKLEAGAEDSGSRLHVLNGNHELMNAAFDFRYVTERSFAEFDELARAPGRAAAPPVAPHARGRALAFAPGGPYALKLAKHDTIAIVGDTLFVHAGVLPEHVDYGLGRINAEVRAFLEGKRELPKALQGDEAPVWTRRYGAPELDAEACALAERVLSATGARRMVIGHTVQKSGISAACGDKVFRIDVGLSAYYGDTEPQVLQITSAGVEILKAGAARPKAGGARPSPALQSAP